MQNILTDDLFATTLANTRAIGAASLDEVRAHPTRLATFSTLAEAQRQQEKRYLYETLYTCHALSLEHDKAKQVVMALFDFWINEPEELPSGYVEQIESEGLARVVADYIAGMTDSFILLQYAHVKRAVRRERTT
jgi:dGTPase